MGRQRRKYDLWFISTIKQAISMIGYIILFLMTLTLKTFIWLDQLGFFSPNVKVTKKNSHFKWNLVTFWRLSLLMPTPLCKQAPLVDARFWKRKEKRLVLKTVCNTANFGWMVWASCLPSSSLTQTYRPLSTPKKKSNIPGAYCWSSHRNVTRVSFDQSGDILCLYA